MNSVESAIKYEEQKNTVNECKYNVTDLAVASMRGVTRQLTQETSSECIPFGEGCLRSSNCCGDSRCRVFAFDAGRCSAEWNSPPPPGPPY